MARPIGDVRAELGECPVFDPETGLLFWLDILGHSLMTTSLQDETTTIRALPKRISCIARRSAGGWIAAGNHDIWLLDADRLTRLAELPSGTPGRFNDGKCDAAGRLWIGTANAEGRTDCALWRFDADDTPQKMMPGIAMSNGIGFSPDGRRLYHVDSSAGRIVAHDLDPAAGSISNPSVFFHVGGPALPDGLAIDLEGHVWLALWGGHKVVRISPTGQISGQVDVPTARVSSCCFGGPDMQTLFITTACEGAAAQERSADPLMGALFRADVGIPGLPVAPFAG